MCGCAVGARHACDTPACGTRRARAWAGAACAETGAPCAGLQVLQGCKNAWAEVSKLPMALDDHSIHEGEEIQHLGHHVAGLPLQ